MSDNEGTGATITFATSAFAAKVLGITIDGVTRSDIEDWDLASLSDKSQPGKVRQFGTVTVEMEFDLNTEPPINAAAETITITQAIKSNEQTAAKLEGDGYINAYTGGFPWNERKTGTYTIKWTDGFTVTAGVPNP